MNRTHAIITCLLALVVLTSCGVLPFPGEVDSSPSPTPDAAPATASPEATGAATVETGLTPAAATGAAPAPTPYAPPTPPPDISAWPLGADLFTLDAAGRVWLHPYDGGEPLPVTPEEQVVEDFTVTPGGGGIVYRAGGMLYHTALDGREGEPYPWDARGGMPAGTRNEHTIAWSPDGLKRAFAAGDGFVVVAPGGGPGAEPGVFEVPEGPVAGLSWSPGSDWLLVRRADGSAVLYLAAPLQRWVDLGALNGHAWLSDGRLAFAPEAGGLAVLTPGDAGSRAFVVPQDRYVTLPTERADGMLAFFSHSGSISEPGFLHAADPFELSFRVESSVAVETGSAVWEPGGARLLTYDGEEETLKILDPLTGAQAELPSTTPVQQVGWGAPLARRVAGLTLPADLYYLAPAGGVDQVWKLPASGEPPQQITYAPEGVASYDISPDGERVLYDSGGALYHAAAGSQEAERLLVLNWQTAAEFPATPAYGPDGAWIAYANGGIWIYELATGIVRQVSVDRNTSGSSRQLEHYENPRFSPDGGWLLADVQYWEASDQALISLGGEPGNRPDPVPLELFGARAEWLPDGTIMAYRSSGDYGSPFLQTVQASLSPAAGYLLDLPVADVQLRPDGRLALLRAAYEGSEISVASVEADGSDLRVETGLFALDGAQLSPDGSLVAGLVPPPLLAEAAGGAGQLALVDAQTGQVFEIEAVASAHALKWLPPR